MSSLSSQYQYQYQPCPQAPMHPSPDSPSEKHQSQTPSATASECAHYPQSQSQSRCCHNQRRRKIKAILIALSSTFLILALLGLVSFQCGMFSGDNWGDGLMKRAITSTTSNGQSVFVKNKRASFSPTYPPPFLLSSRISNVSIMLTMTTSIPNSRNRRPLPRPHSRHHAQRMVLPRLVPQPAMLSVLFVRVLWWACLPRMHIMWPMRGRTRAGRFLIPGFRMSRTPGMLYRSWVH